MIDFIVVGVLFVAVMFVVCFVLSFVTIGITYTLAKIAKGFIDRIRPQPALK